MRSPDRLWILLAATLFCSAAAAQFYARIVYARIVAVRFPGSSRLLYATLDIFLPHGYDANGRRPSGSAYRPRGSVEPSSKTGHSPS